MLKEIGEKIGEYTNAKDKYLTYSGDSSSSDDSTLSSIQNRDTKFTHTATISTDFKNVQRVSQENAARIFGVRSEDYNKLKVGRTFKLPGNDMNDVKVTLLGKNSYDYHRSAQGEKDVEFDKDEPQAQVLFNQGKALITGQDNQYKVNNEFNKMINKVEASELIEKQNQQAS